MREGEPIVQSAARAEAPKDVLSADGGRVPVLLVAVGDAKLVTLEHEAVRDGVEAGEPIDGADGPQRSALSNAHASRPVQIPPPVRFENSRDLEDFRSEFDRLFCDVADFLSSFGDRIDRLLGDIESFVAVDRVRLSATVVAESQEMALSYRREAMFSMKLTDGFVVHTNILMQSIARMAGALKQIGAISGRVRLVGLNALTAAARLGSGGAALSVLAQNLTTLTEDDAAVAGRLGVLADSLADRIQMLADVRSRIETMARDGLEHSDLPIEGLSSTLASIVADLVSILETARHLRTTMGKVMIGLQRQDILRQGIDNVRLVLDTLCEEHSLLPQTIDPADAAQCRQVRTFLLFQERAATLAAAVLDESRAELQSLVDQTRGGMDGMTEALTLLLGVREKVSDCIRSKLRLPAVVFENLAHSLEAQLEASLHFREVVQGISSLAEKLHSDLACLQTIRVQLRTVRILMRTEIARATAASGTASIVADIGKGEDELGSFLDINRKEAGQLESALRLITGVADNVYRHRQQMSATKGRLRERPDEILHAGAEFGRHFDDLARTTDGMQTTLRQVGRGLSAFRARLSALTDLQQLCQRLASAAAQRRTDLFGAEAGEDQLPAGRMAEIIDSFTIFSHKRIGGELAGMELAEGDAEGTLTLF
jgi:hypothetical protein